MRSRLALFALLAGCTKEEGIDVLVTAMDPPEVSELVVGSSVGAGTVLVPVLQLNTYGIPTGGGSTSVLLEGVGLSTASASVEFDVWGWGEVEVSSATPQPLTARLSSGAEAVSWITSPLEVSYGLYPGWNLGFIPDRVEPVESGLVLQSGAELYWMPTGPSAQPVRVAALPEAPAGWVVSDIDEDGVSDIALWLGNEVHLLRGRSAGGFGWQAGYTVEQPVAGVAVGRVDEQYSLDLVVAWSDDGEGGFQVLSGDGAWGFTATAPRLFETDLWAVQTGDWDLNGVAEVAVMIPNPEEDDEGIVVRYIGTADGWLTTGYELGGNYLDAPLREGSGFAANPDIDGDGMDEMVLVGSPTQGSRRPLAFYTFADEDTTLYQFDFAAYTLAVADLSDDGAEELVLVESDEGVMRMITSDTDDGTLKNRSLGAMALPAAIAVADVDDAGLPDVVTAADRMLAWPGEADETMTGGWDLRSEGWSLFSVAASGVVDVRELDGDAQPEVLVVRAVSGTVVLQLLHVATSDEGGLTIQSEAGARASVDEGGAGEATGLDLAVCEGVAYVLVEDNGRFLYSVDLRDPTNLTLLGGVSVNATAIACGALEGGAVAALVGAQAQLYDADLNAVGTQAVASGAQDLAIADLDGGGLAVVTCESAGCSLLAVDLDGDGLHEVIEGGSSATLTAWGQSVPLGAVGAPGAVDYDQDGVLDVVLHDADTGVVEVLRVLDGGVAPSLLLHTRQSLAGPAMSGDADGDGVEELFFTNPDGGLYFSEPSGG